MDLTVIPVGVYAYLPEAFCRFLAAIYEGRLTGHKVTDLLYRHCGDVPAWGAGHVTLLPVVPILDTHLENLRRAFSRRLREDLPITLSKPHLVRHGSSIVLEWARNREWQRLAKLRRDLANLALRFILYERVSLDCINRIGPIVSSQDVQPEFRKGYRRLISWLLRGHLSNMVIGGYTSLEYLVLRIHRNQVQANGRIPWNLQPHASIATALRNDMLHGMSKSEVADFIVEHLPKVPGFQEALHGRPHRIDAAYVVETAQIGERRPIKVVVNDFRTGMATEQFRMPWVPRERIV